MEELDKLKRDWQQRDHKFPDLSEQDLYNMLHRKSSSIVKWILMISLLEFFILCGFSFFYSFDGFKEISKNKHIELLIDLVTYLNFIVIVVFMYLFYKNYKSISVTVNTQKLMSQIIHVRKTVRNYVYYNLILAALSFMFGIFLAFDESKNMEGDLAGNIYLQVIMLLLCLFLLLFFLGIVWLYYKLLYGLLLKRLHKNYLELKNIDT